MQPKDMKPAQKSLLEVGLSWLCFLVGPGDDPMLWPPDSSPEAEGPSGALQILGCKNS